MSRMDNTSYMVFPMSEPESHAAAMKDVELRAELSFGKAHIT